MDNLYKELLNIFVVNPKILYGFTEINFGEYKEQYKSALVYAIPHKIMLNIKNYKEEILEHLIVEARNEINEIQNNIEEIIIKYSVKYHFPEITQKNEEELISPISFKYLGIKAGIGWIGKNDLLITKEYGPRIRLGAVLIDYNFPINNIFSENNCPENCIICVNSCPYKLLNNKLWDNEIKREEIINYKLCNRKRSSFINKIGRKHSCGYCMVSCKYGFEN